MRLVTMQEVDKEASKETPATDEKATDEKATDEKATDEKATDEKATDEKATDEKATDEKATDEKATDEPEKEPTFEEQRAEIERALATPKAIARLDAAMQQIYSKMQKYFDLEASRSGYSAEDLAKMEVLQKPDLAALAASYGLTFETIGFHDAFTIRDEPVADSQVAGGLQMQGPSFVQVMYTLTPSGDPEKPLYSPLLTSAFVVETPAISKQYISWKIEEKAAYIPTIDEVRTEVVNSWRTIKAGELASKAATKIATELNESPEKTLAELVPEDKKKEFLNESLPAFQWMNPTFSQRKMQALRMQLTQDFLPDSATIGNVPELDNVGEGFMKAVFTASLNQAATAMNESGTAVYVVQPTQFTPSVNVLREQFKLPRSRNDVVVQMLSGNDNAAILNGFFESVDEEAGYVNNMSEQQ